MNVIIIVVVSLTFTFVLLAVIKYIVNENQKKLVESISGEIAVSGVEIVISPERGSFRGATQNYGKIKCDGVMYLSKEKLVFNPLMGKNIIKINLCEIQKITMEKAFLGKWVAGVKVMVLHLADSTQVGFFVKDNELWKHKIEDAKG